MRYGIMQGRLTPSNGRGIQFFPFDNWKQEFYISKEIGIEEIEWIFDYDSYEDNPLWSEKGIENIQNTIKETSVTIRSVCFDYFMRRPFYKGSNEDLLEENITIGRQVIKNMAKVGAGLLEIPMVDDSSIKTKEEKNKAASYINNLSSYAVEYGVKIGLETDFPPEEFRDFLELVPNVWANYDSGNSSGLGYNHRDELLSLNDRLANVHIKDRVYKGGTVKLGTGSADFDAVFSSLKEIGYNESIILQAARDEDGKEIKSIKNQLHFVKEYVKKYKMEK